MILHDQKFEDLAQAPVKETNVEVARQIFDPYGSYDDTPIWASSDILMSVKIDSMGAFLGTVTKKATVKLLGVVEGVASGDTFQIRLGIYDNDPGVLAFNYISQGFFIVDDVEYDYEAGSTTVVMYDYMRDAQNTQYSEASGTAGFEYPATVESLAGQMASAIGVDLMATFSTLPNSDFVIESDPYINISNATLQTVIHEIAAATGTTARISDTTLTFVQYEIEEENLTSDNLKKLKIGDPYGPVTSVVLGRVPQNDNVVIASAAPEANVITDINTTTSLFTVVGNAMVDGNLVRIESDNTVPAPLEEGRNYYAFTNGSSDTFALADNYNDAIAGTNLIDLTSAGSGNIRLSHLETQEIQINNNQIVDEYREDLLPNIYSELVGIEWNEVESSTVGLGWHEVGDVIQFTQGPKTVNAFIDSINLTLDGSIKEKLKSSTPDLDTINYQTAGGILKTIYNTEIKVDKQENEISSVVSQQDVYATETQDNFTELYQNLENIVLTIQKSGGGNLIDNSVGFATERKGINLLETDFSAWESGGYDINDGTKYADGDRLRSVGFYEVEAGTDYYISTNSTRHRTLIRQYDNTEAFISNAGGYKNGDIYTPSAGVSKITIQIFLQDPTTESTMLISSSYSEFERYFNSGEIVPLMSLNSQMDSDMPLSWNLEGDGTAASYSSSSSQNQGGVSGQVIEMEGDYLSFTQRVNVSSGTALSFGLRVKNEIGTGEATITLSNDNESFQLEVDSLTDYDWEEIKIEDFSTTLPWLDVNISISNALGFAFTDLRLLYGNSLQGWVQSASEILSTNVQFTKLGMRIFDNLHDTETNVTYNEFSTRRRSDGAVLFEADDSGVITNDLSIRGSTSYYDGNEEIIRQITIPSSSAMAGIAFIRVQ